MKAEKIKESPKIPFVRPKHRFFHFILGISSRAKVMEGNFLAVKNVRVMTGKHNTSRM